MCKRSPVYILDLHSIEFQDCFILQKVSGTSGTRGDFLSLKVCECLDVAVFPYNCLHSCREQVTYEAYIVPFTFFCKVSLSVVCIIDDYSVDHTELGLFLLHKADVLSRSTGSLDCKSII